MDRRAEGMPQQAARADLNPGIIELAFVDGELGRLLVAATTAAERRGLIGSPTMLAAEQTDVGQLLHDYHVADQALRTYIHRQRYFGKLYGRHEPLFDATVPHLVE